MLTRVQACLSERQVKFIEREARQKGITVSDQVRRILDEFLDTKSKEKEKVGV